MTKLKNLIIFFDKNIQTAIIKCMKDKIQNKKLAITKDMLIDDVIKLDQRLGDVFMGFGMHCIFCHLGLEETVEEASLVHEVDVDFLVKKLNETYENLKK